MKIHHFLVGVVVIFSTITGYSKQDLTSEQLAFFENKVRPILASKCLECHSAEKGKVKGGLVLDSRVDILKGGESGPVYNPDAPDKSALLRAINWDGDVQMPEKEKMSAENIAVLTEWFKQGIPDPREKQAKFDKASHWAFQPVQKPALPNVKNVGWCNNSIDRFVLAKLEQNKMMPAPLANKEVLLRRLYLDVIGIPPTVDQIQKFVANASPKAYETVVDSLLADPAYGERWGRHWLDTARYSDTNGNIQNQQLNDYRYPYAWTYREWVFNTINQDMPYDQFLKNQIAADKMINNDKKNLAALGFLTVGQRFNNKDDVINDRIDVIGRGMLGLTVACARCHDHKFDPVTSADYYALRGIFASCTEPVEGPVIGGDENSATFMEFKKKLEELEAKNIEGYYSLIRSHADGTRKNAALMFEYMLDTDAGSTPEQIEAVTKKIDAVKITARSITDDWKRHFKVNDKFFGPFVRLAKCKPDEIEATKLVIKHDTKNKYSPITLEFIARQELPSNTSAEMGELVGKFFAEIEPQIPSIYAQIMEPKTDAATLNMDTVELAAFPFPILLASDISAEKIRQEGNKLPLRMQGQFASKTTLNQINELKLTFSGGPVRAMAIEDLPKPVESPLFVRGNAPKAGETPLIIPRRFIDVLSPGGKSEAFNKTDSGRLELAEAIANKNNPLTARVLVNRTWMYYFGEGLVRTPDDLGNQAGMPSHPELLDFLTAWFLEDYPNKPAWSTKALHKAILTSKTYQQSSTLASKELLAINSKIDPSNSLLWHANIRRLDFEAYRDTLLSMANVLDKTYGGPSFNVMEEPYIFRRTAYSYIDRLNIPDVLMQFDMSNPDQPNTKRTSTIVPQQALFLMNSPLVAGVIQKIVQRPEVVNAVLVEKNTDKGIAAIFKIVLQRSPTIAERKMALEFLLQESKAQDAVKLATDAITMQAMKTAEIKLKAASNNNNAKKAIVNHGQLVRRTAFSPWETLVQALIFCNETAYIN
jgi:hypothetical protein